MANKLPPKKRQWLWFIGLYLLSIIAVASVSYLLKGLLPH